MSDPDMRQLFHDYYEQPDSPDKLGLPQGHVDFWKLEATMSDNAEIWGWRTERCAVCPSDEVVYWDTEKGYRCEAHRREVRE
jgi:hypothetical protein